MNEKEEYFRIKNQGHRHVLSDRIPLRWKELMVWSFSSFVLLIFLLGWLTGLLVALLTLIGYIFYRFAASIYYTEIHFDTTNGRVTRIRKFLDRNLSKELITESFEPSRMEFTKIQRSGKTKYLMNYRTHKNHELLILKNEADKTSIEKYFNT